MSCEDTFLVESGSVISDFEYMKRALSDRAFDNLCVVRPVHMLGECCIGTR